MSEYTGVATQRKPMTENPHRDGEIRTHDPRHPKASEGDRARPPVPMNGGISPAGPVISERSQSSVDTGCGHSGGHTEVEDAWDFSPLPDDFVPPKVVVKNWKRITWSALPQPHTPQESHGSWPPVRFWSNVEVDENDCWIWRGAKWSEGYGRFARVGRAHRHSWEMHFGAIPDGLFVLHACDVRACCNPLHLFLGTGADNNRDMASKGRSKSPRGQDASGAVLTREQVRDIRLRLIAGETRTNLSREFCVGITAISNIGDWSTWSDQDEDLRGLVPPAKYQPNRLHESDRARIQEMLDEGMSLRRIADLMGVHNSSLSKFMRSDTRGPARRAQESQRVAARFRRG